MKIDFTKECLLQAAQETKNQFNWAWRNFICSKDGFTDRWQGLALFLFTEHCRLVEQAKKAPSEFMDDELIEEAARKTA